MATVSGVRSGISPRTGSPRGPIAAGFAAGFATGFSVPAGAAGAADETAASASVTSTSVTPTSVPAIMTGMLSLQELGCERPEDRAARRRGHELLAALAALQRALLANSDDPAALVRLAVLARNAPPAADPRLREAVTALVLRAHVELAKRGA